MAKAGPRLAVLGAGPIGLEAAILAHKLGLSVTVYERGRVAENLERWGFVRLFTPFGSNSTTIGRSIVRAERKGHDLPGDNDFLTGREHVAAYLQPLAASSLLANVIKTEQQVIAVSRTGTLKADLPRESSPFRMLLRDSKGTESYADADVVFDCTGTYGNPRHLGDGGLPAIGELAARQLIASGLEDILGGQKSKYAGKTILLVGAGYTAATHVDLLADLAKQAPETWVIWLARGPRSTPLPRIANDPFRERDKLAVRANSLATRGEGNVEFHPSSIIESIVSLGQDKGFQVTERVVGIRKSWDVDRIIASVGYRPDFSIYRELQVQECPIHEGPANGSIFTTEPNFFILGAKSRGRDSQFLLKTGLDQVREALAKVTGKPVPEKP
jgi:thioredoxin reductase